MSANEVTIVAVVIGTVIFEPVPMSMEKLTI